MDTFNPYRAPSAPLYVAPVRARPPAACWREGAVLRVRGEGELPARCVKCNAPATAPMQRRTYYWHHPALYLLLLANFLIYLVVALIVRKQLRVAAGLCDAHRRRRRNWLALAWLGTFAGIGTVIAGTGAEHGAAILFGFVLLLSTLVAGLMGARILSASRIDADGARFKGCGEAFLAGLPDGEGKGG